MNGRHIIAMVKSIEQGCRCLIFTKKILNKVHTMFMRTYRFLPTTPKI